MASSKSCLFFLLLFFFINTTEAQSFTNAPDTLLPQQKRDRLLGLSVGFAAGYTSGMIILHQAWYKYDNRTNFHFFNDNRHWNQMDKAGHFWATFHQSRLGVDMLKWAGVNEKRALIYGSLVEILFQTPIEIFYGFSEEYGASLGDMAANTLGTAGVLAQHLLWGEVRIMPKFSFHTTKYSTTRLQMLRENYFEQMLKDYNGQTYWLAVNVSAFLPKVKKLPSWLNLAIGYGAEEMVVGDPNLNRQMGYNSFRQYFLSIDLNLMNIETRSKLLKKIFYVASIVRVPAPALEFNRKNKLIFHPIYY